jgi:hypothetical protein
VNVTDGSVAITNSISAWQRTGQLLPSWVALRMIEKA